MILTKCNIKEVNLDELIETKISSSSLNELLLIVPTNRKVRYLKRELISSSPSKAVSGINIETIGTYSLKLISGSSLQNSVVSDEASIVLLKQCFRESGLKYFSNYKVEIPFGTLERVKNVISEYKKHGISPAKLLNESENLVGTEKQKAQDISKIYAKYEEKYTALGIKDIGDIYKSVNQLDLSSFENRFREFFPGVKTIIINGFDEFTLPEIEIINSSAEIKDLDLYLNFDYYNYNPAIFSHLDNCYEKLEHKGFKSVRDSSVVDKKSFVEDIKENLFLKKESEENNNYISKIAQITAFNREAEIALIAKEIKSIIKRNNVEPSRICVAFNLIKPYSQIIRDQFTSYSIPFNLTDRLSISTSPPVITIINLLEIISNDFYYKNLFRSLSNNLIRIDDVDTNNLLKASVELKIVAGFNSWTNRLTDTIKENESGIDTDSEWKRYDVNYKKALKDLKSIYKFLQPFDKPLTPSRFYNNLLDLISSLNIHVNVLRKNNNSAEKDIKALNTFLGSVKEIINLFELEYGAEQKHPLKFFLRQLITIASFSRYNIKEKHGYGVQVTTLNEIRGLNFDYLFIAGLSDGDFPTRFSPEVFFSGSFGRQELRHQVEERYLFYQALCSWQKALYFTNPLTDERKELVESGFLKEFKRKFKITQKKSEDYTNIIASEIELQKHVGNYIGLINEKPELPADINIGLNSINQSIDINRLRLETPFADSIYCGVLTGEITDQLKNKLEELKDKQFSVTQLESYARCPYQYFTERVLRLNTLEEPTEELEAFELGKLLHNILFEFYTEIKTAGVTIQNANEKNFRRAEKMIFDIAHKKIESMKLSSSLSFFEKEKLLGIGDDKRNSLLYRFLIEEKEAGDGFIPEFFEVEFGHNENDQSDKTEPGEEFKIGDVKIRGKIDRIDIRNEGGTFKVIDYKLSGKKPTKADLLSGISLQLPLYMYAAKEILAARKKKHIQPYSPEIYSLKFDEKNFGPHPIRVDNSRSKDRDVMTAMSAEMINKCEESINLFVKNITSGKFNLSTLEDRETKVCRFCNFRSVCRVQEIN